MSPEQPPKRDYRQEVTDSIIRMLEAGTAPWQKPWQPGALEMPFNPTSEKSYRGGNAIHLLSTAVVVAYSNHSANVSEVRQRARGQDMQR